MAPTSSTPAGRGPALAHWRRFGEEWGEPLFQPVGTLWFGHRPDGFEAASLAVLPARASRSSSSRGRGPPALAADRVRGRRLPGLRAGGRGAHGPPGHDRRGPGLRTGRRPVRAGRRAAGPDEGRRLVDVVLGDGRRLAAGTFVFAAGPWLPRLFPGLLGNLIRVTKQDVFFFGPAGGDGRFTSAELPTWVDYDAAFYGVPGIDGRGPKLAPDRYGPVFDPSPGERIVDPDSTRLARAYAARRFPALAGQPIVETRVCQYETTPDSHFIIDRHPDLENAWIAGGGSGHAFKHGPRIGEYLVERLQGAPVGPGEERFSLTVARRRHHPADRRRRDGRRLAGLLRPAPAPREPYSLTSSGPSASSWTRPSSTTTS